MQSVPRHVLELVRSFQTLLSEKVRHQLDAGFFDTDDLIESILNGSLIKKEKDETKMAKYKYTIIGPARSGIPLYSCGKVVRWAGKSYFIITFHEAR